MAARASWKIRSASAREMGAAATVGDGAGVAVGDGAGVAVADCAGVGATASAEVGDGVSAAAAAAVGDGAAIATAGAVGAAGCGWASSHESAASVSAMSAITAFKLVRAGFGADMGTPSLRGARCGRERDIAYSNRICVLASSAAAPGGICDCPAVTRRRPIFIAVLF